MTPLRQLMIRELELQRRSPNTINAYVNAVAQLAAHFKRSPELISREEIRDFFHLLVVKRKLADSTVNQKLSAVKFFYRNVLQQKDFNLKIARRKSGRLPTPLSRTQVKQLLEATQNPKHRAMLMTAYSGGLRLNEIIHLKVNDLHSQRMLIHVRHGKGDKDRFTLLSKRLLIELRQYWTSFRPQSWLFPGRITGPMSDRTLQRVFYRAKEKAAIKGKFSIHSLRHSFATHLLESGTDIVTIQKLMGHSRLETTARYLHVTNKHVQGIKNPLDLLRLPTPDDVRSC